MPHQGKPAFRGVACSLPMAAPSAPRMFVQMALMILPYLLPRLAARERNLIVPPQRYMQPTLRTPGGEPIQHVLLGLESCVSSACRSAMRT